MPSRVRWEHGRTIPRSECPRRARQAMRRRCTPCCGSGGVRAVPCGTGSPWTLPAGERHPLGVSDSETHISWRPICGRSAQGPRTPACRSGDNAHPKPASFTQTQASDSRQPRTLRIQPHAGKVGKRVPPCCPFMRTLKQNAPTGAEAFCDIKTCLICIFDLRILHIISIHALRIESKLFQPDTRHSDATKTLYHMLPGLRAMRQRRHGLLPGLLGRGRLNGSSHEIRGAFAENRWNGVRMPYCGKQTAHV